MGALTDHRKRCLADLRLPFSAAAGDAPPAKKPKFPPPSTAPDWPPQPPPPAAVRLCRFPPAAPLSRPVHGPQRIIKAFGLGSTKRTLPKDWFSRKGSSFEMGNLVSRFFREKKPSWSCFSGRRQKGEDAVVQDGHERLGLEEYKQLVFSSEEDGFLVVSDERPPAKEGFSRPFASPLVDLTVATQEDEKPSNAYVLNRKVEDARKVALESSPAVKKEPLYKELYDAARKRDNILNSLEFEVKLTEEKISGFRFELEELKKEPKEDLHDLFAPLTDEEENEVYHALHGGRSREVLVTHEASNIAITRENLQCLSYGAWLNDEVINLYLDLLKEREQREPKKFLKCHFFNTFFYKKLISGRNGYDYKAVRRWTTQKKLGYGLIECDKIFVPVHKDIHWCLAVINVKDEAFLYLDSLGGMDTNVLQILARYLMDEVKDKSNKEIDTTSWKLASVAGLPLQKNGWDCGMFMLKYCDFNSRGLSLHFSQEHMEYFRKRTAKEILRLRAE